LGLGMAEDEMEVLFL